jgi:hypothetical protein
MYMMITKLRTLSPCSINSARRYYVMVIDIDVGLISDGGGSGGLMSYTWRRSTLAL